MVLANGNFLMVPVAFNFYFPMKWSDHSQILTCRVTANLLCDRSRTCDSILFLLSLLPLGIKICQLCCWVLQMKWVNALLAGREGWHPHPGSGPLAVFRTKKDEAVVGAELSGWSQRQGTGSPRVWLTAVVTLRKALVDVFTISWNDLYIRL